VDGTAQFDNVSVLHQGIELEADYRLGSVTGLQRHAFFGVIGDTRKISQRIIFDDQNNPVSGDDVTLFVKDAKVGDAAQTTAYLGGGL
jgi:hypothetical protein